MRRRLKARKVIPIGILAVCLLLMYKVFWLDKHIEKEKAVLYVEGVEEFEKKIRKENCIIIPDCKEYLIDYDSEKQTLLYINNQDELVEKNLWTGEAKILDIGGDIRGLQYGPGKDEIAYAREEDANMGGIYTYNLDDGVERRITDGLPSSWLHTYAWKDESTLFVINEMGEDKVRTLFVWKEGGEKEQIDDTSSIWSIASGEDENKMYGIIQGCRFNGITIEFKYKLIEIDLKNNTVKELTDIDTQSNCLFECIDDKYLVYVEEGSYERRSKVYCYYIETGEKKCIFKTNKEIVGVFVK
ncbi:MAG: hypothetical protein HFI00_16525 [Lachnospiraceae bacterium]|nr:hypothetical protein [Lachnospiraceae bacterium]